MQMLLQFNNQDHQWMNLLKLISERSNSTKSNWDNSRNKRKWTTWSCNTKKCNQHSLIHKLLLKKLIKKVNLTSIIVRCWSNKSRRQQVRSLTCQQDNQKKLQLRKIMSSMISIVNGRSKNKLTLMLLHQDKKNLKDQSKWRPINQRLRWAESNKSYNRR